MNKMVTSVLAVGAGMMAYNYARRNNMISNRQMKRIGKRISKAF
jgi:hypothetical protein